MQLSNRGHECATANSIVGGSTWHQIASSVIDCVELARPVWVSDVFKERFYLRALPRLTKMFLCDTDLSKGRGKQEIDRFGLISIVLEVCHWLHLLTWDVCSDRRTTKSAILISLGTDNVPGANPSASAKVLIWLECFLTRFSMDAFGSVPLTIHISWDSKGMVLRRWVKPLSKVFDFT